jgi:hypothetical protein
MTTKNRQLITVTGMIAGGLKAYQLTEKKENILPNVLLGVGIGGLSMHLLCIALSEPKDTVNYTCYRKRKNVYEGITYVDRKSKRVVEHKADGKKFSHVVFSRPKPRSAALLTEKRRIIKHKPLYNIQLNSPL